MSRAELVTRSNDWISLTWRPLIEMEATLHNWRNSILEEWINVAKQHNCVVKIKINTDTYYISPDYTMETCFTYIAIIDYIDAITNYLKNWVHTESFSSHFRDAVLRTKEIFDRLNKDCIAEIQRKVSNLFDIMLNVLNFNNSEIQPFSGWNVDNLISNPLQLQESIKQAQSILTRLKMIEVIPWMFNEEALNAILDSNIFTWSIEWSKQIWKYRLLHNFFVK